MVGNLKGKTIALGVSGGISSYKAAELARLLIREGALVFVVMSANAGKFITPLMFQALTGRPVYENMFQSAESAGMDHIYQAEQADAFIIAPASGSVIGKLANGLADDALSTFFLAYNGPVIVAPAMNDKMYMNPAVQDNLEKLLLRGINVLEPSRGELACGSVGLGRLPEPKKLLDAVCKTLFIRQDLSHLRILVTAGPTREAIDPVRFIGNRSSGKMGYAVAERARLRGAQVTVVSGPCHLRSVKGIRVVDCESAEQMADCVIDNLPECDVLVMTAAVGDFAPESVASRKIKKTVDNTLKLKLKPTRDILKEIAEQKTSQIVVGFAAETENLLENAIDKLRKKRLDMIVANDVGKPGIGFEAEENKATIILNEHSAEELEKMSKIKLADILLDRILDVTKRVSPI